MVKYRAPKNYKYDAKSGQYCRELQIKDDRGRPIHHVIWFDAETGEYTQKSYYASSPNKSAQKSVQKPLLFFALLLIVCGGIFLCSNSFFLKKPISKEELIESVEITDENSKTISFQDYNATLNEDE